MNWAGLHEWNFSPASFESHGVGFRVGEARGRTNDEQIKPFSYLPQIKRGYGVWVERVIEHG
jgi:hypothetical protein